MLHSAIQRFESAGASLANLWEARTDPLALFLRATAQGDLTPLDVGPFDLLVTADAGLAEQILQQPQVFTKDTRGQRVLRGVLGNGLVTAQGPVWRERRRIAQPAFRRPKLAVYAQSMVEEATTLAQRWAGRDGEVVDVGHEMMQLTLKIATRCLFDDDLHGEAEAVDQALQSILAAYLRMVTQPFAHPERLPVGPAVAYRRSVRELDAVVSRLIERRRSAGSDGDDLLHLWLHSGLDDDAIRDEVVTMLLAAHETTANALTWTWTLLSRHPQALRKLVAEVNEGDDRTWTDAVIRESLRIYPPVWTLARHATTDAILDGHAIPAGSNLTICIYAMHHDARYWPHPEGFDPDRWLSKSTSSGPWMPFGAGQRKCIGSHFALLEARIVLATLVQHVDLELLPGQSLAMSPSITLRPELPIHMRVRASS